MFIGVIFYAKVTVLINLFITIYLLAEYDIYNE